MLVLLAVLCAGACSRECPPEKAQSRDDQQRVMLNEGYSILRHDARTISAVRLLLYVKVESDEFEKVVLEAADFGSQLKKDLDELPHEFPAVEVDLEPLPVMERRKRLATGFDKFKDIAPFSGLEGMAWERVLLISLTNGINQERHLVSEMAEEEPAPGLKKFLNQTRTRMDQVYEHSMALLERKYFVHEKSH